MDIKMVKSEIEKAKLGAKIVTDFGRPARIICWDAVGNYPVVALVYDKKTKSERVVMLSSALKVCLDGNDSFDDLCLLDTYPHDLAHVEVHKIK